MREFVVLLLSALTVHPLLGQSDTNTTAECPHPIENVGVNPINRKSNEKHNRRDARYIVFEENFRDTISILVENKIIFKKYMYGDENEIAHKVQIKTKAKSKITIRAADKGCIQFNPRKGYKYIYVQRPYDGRWTVTYSNYIRRYY